jgi:hypothetical protein
MTNPPTFAPFIAAVLLLLQLLYVGSYLALVVPRGVWRSKGTGSSAAASRTSTDRYRYGGSLADSFFWPLEQIDRGCGPVCGI